jgi:predicted phosphodiesterase
MRIALISDIHGNLVSLKAVLADITRERIDQVVCLGDVATLGPQPREVIALLKTLGCPCVMGNHDSFLLNPALIHEYTDAPWVVEVVDWCVSQLSRADIDYLQSFQPLLEIPVGAGSTLLCFHGSPRSSQDLILATTPAAELDEMLDGHTATIMAGGHTHLQMLRQHKGLMIVNAGSVGAPLEQLPFEGRPCILPWAEYAIVSLVNGVLSAELRRIPIDLDAVKQATLASDMPIEATD